MENDQNDVMQELRQGVASTAAALRQHKVDYALIGGLAAGFRSQARFTKDVDFLLQIPQVTLPRVLETLESQGFQLDQLATIREWTEHHMVVLSYHGIQVDWLKAVIPAYQHILDRATEESWLGQRVRVASTEGLILTVGEYTHGSYRVAGRNGHAVCLRPLRRGGTNRLRHHTEPRVCSPGANNRGRPQRPAYCAQSGHSAAKMAAVAAA